MSARPSLSRRSFAGKGFLGSLAAMFGANVTAAAPVSGKVRGRLSMDEISHRIEIDDLLTRYTIAVDDEQFDLLDTVFTSDAVLDYTAGGGPRGPYPAVKAWLARSLSQGTPARMHMIGNKQVIIEGDTAKVRAYFFNPFVRDLPNGGWEYSLGGGYYNHLLRLTPDGWRSTELYEKRVWRQGFAPVPHPHNARSTEVWDFGGPAHPHSKP
jgi:hypothetical protein